MKKRGSASDKKQTVLALAVLTVFATPFAAAGLGILLFMTAPMVYDWARMQAWQSVPAQVESATLQSHASRKGGTSYSVSARYHYQVAGVQYTGTRTSITTRADNIGSFHERLGRELQGAQRTGEPVPVWVNPSQPSESVVDRSLRPGLLAFQITLAAVFGGFGVGILLWMWRALWRSWRGRAAS